MKDRNVSLFGRNSYLYCLKQRIGSRQPDMKKRFERNWVDGRLLVGGS